MTRLRDQLTYLNDTTWMAAGQCGPALDEALALLAARDAQSRIWGRDGTLWRQDPKAAQRVEERLGWLSLPDDMRIEIDRLRALALEAQSAGMTQVVLLGMGGSSLAPEVFRQVLGVAEGACELFVLDSTDAAEVRRTRAQLDLAKTLFVVASKSGTTAEPLSLMAYFREQLRQELGEGVWPCHFIAITDPGTPLRASAEDDQFRALYLNPPDIGGRYSALSLFGLVPAALIGVDIERLLDHARVMAHTCRDGGLAMDNPGIALGVWMGALAAAPKARRNKLTLITSPELAAFGPWVEQLIAESTGKEGKGILPVEGEALTAASRLSQDRSYVYLRLDQGQNEASDALAQALVERGEPLMMLAVAQALDLGAEFFRWEYATAVAGLLLNIDPFNQPNVEMAKKQARAAIETYAATRTLPEPEPLIRGVLAAVDGPDLNDEGATLTTSVAYLTRFLQQLQPGGFVALMAYVDRSPAHEQALQALRMLLQERLGVPVTVGFGPRFLHSTGQLHKGGPAGGLYIQLTHDVVPPLAIPGESYTFQVLQRAQALGDLHALRQAGRSAVRLHLKHDVSSTLDQLCQGLKETL